MSGTTWVDIYRQNTTTGVVALDLLTASLGSGNLQRATVVAVKGAWMVRAFADSVAPEVAAGTLGFMVAPSTYVAADFPVTDATSQGNIHSGWMWRGAFEGYSSGDGANSLHPFNHHQVVDVKSKRDLKGPGLTSLWIVFDNIVTPSSGAMASTFVGAALVYIP